MWKIILALLTFFSSPAAAQFFSTCSSGSDYELEQSIRAHEEHIYRLSKKFLDGYYLQRKNLPKDFAPANRDMVVRYLAQLPPARKTAVLFYAYSDHRLCTWLLAPPRTAVAHSQAIESAWFKNIDTKLKNALGVTASEAKRAPVQRGLQSVKPDTTRTDEATLAQTIHELSTILLPPPIAAVLLKDSVRVLVLVPVAPLGTIPFGLLQLGGKMLIDRMSIVMAPGFFIFKASPELSPRDFTHPLLAGNPIGWTDREWIFPALPGAREEVLAVAGALNAVALVDSAASQKNIMAQLRKYPNAKLIYLATHGIASWANPRDASFLLMSDGRWPAAKIQNLGLKSRPLVVLSACQTGLGKDFDVGTIGMARAWQRAGASSIVMSLWNVDDFATQQLMTQFIRLLPQWPVDEALRLAMQQARAVNPHPAYWAGFSVFGAPGY